MARKIGQVRWFGENKTTNYPRSLVLADFRRGTMFPRTDSILQLSVQAPAGVQFYLNANPDVITLGPSGQYSINVEGSTVITSVQFAAQTLNTMKNGTVIIDYIYESPD